MKFVAIFSLIMASAFAAGPTCNNAGVVQLVKSGAPDGMIVMGIEQNQCSFEIADADVAQLKASGVSDTVIAAMKKKAAANLFGGQQQAAVPQSATAAGSVQATVNGKTYPLQSVTPTMKDGSSSLGRQALAPVGFLTKKARIKQTSFVEAVPVGNNLPEGDVTISVNVPGATNLLVVRLKEKDDRLVIFTRDMLPMGDPEYNSVAKPASQGADGVIFAVKLDKGAYAIVDTALHSVVWPFTVGDVPVLTSRR